MVSRLINYGAWLAAVLVWSALVALLFGRMDLMDMLVLPVVILVFVLLYLSERHPEQDDSPPKGNDGTL